MGRTILESTSEGIKIFIRSAGLALAVSLVTSAFQIAGVINVAMAYLLMALAWVVAVFSVVLIDSREATSRGKLSWISIVTVVLLAATYWMGQKRAELDMADAQPKLSIDSEPNPMSIIHENKMFRRKASKRARIMVTGAGKKRVENVKAFVTKVNDIDCRVQLPVSSLDTAFERPNPSPVEGAATLNLGEEQYFDALVECIAPACTGGQLAIPSVESGRLRFSACLKNEDILRPKTLRVEVFGDGGTPVTKTFIVSEPGRELLLHPELEETAKQDSHQQ